MSCCLPSDIIYPYNIVKPGFPKVVDTEHPEENGTILKVNKDLGVEMKFTRDSANERTTNYLGIMSLR